MGCPCRCVERDGAGRCRRVQLAVEGGRDAEIDHGAGDGQLLWYGLLLTGALLPVSATVTRIWLTLAVR